MNHLTEIQVNEYLDSALDVESRRHAETHLAACPECRARLDELQVVFAALDTIPEQVPGRDLALAVLARLPQPRERLFWRLILAAQAIGAIVLLAWLGTSLPGTSYLWLREVRETPDLTALSRPLTDAWLAARGWQASLPGLEWPSIRPDATLWAALALAGLAFVLGNALFLRTNGKEAQG